jgi:hypothetical protein
VPVAADGGGLLGVVSLVLASARRPPLPVDPLPLLGRRLSASRAYG